MPRQKREEKDGSEAFFHVMSLLVRPFPVHVAFEILAQFPAATAEGIISGGFPLLVDGVGIGLPSEQQINHVTVIPAGGQHEGGASHPSGAVDIRSLFEKPFRNRGIFTANSFPEQGIQFFPFSGNGSRPSRKSKISFLPRAAEAINVLRPSRP